MPSPVQIARLQTCTKCPRSLVLASLVPSPTLAVADGLHHRYARNGSGIQPNKSHSRQFCANSDVMGVSLINGVS